MQIIWDFIQKQLLGMKWLNDLLGIFLSTLGLDVTDKIGGSIQFFLYDTIKICVLLVALIFLISYIQTYFSPEKTKKILMKVGGIKGNILAALLGTVTPFCSCSSIPIFIGFTEAGLPLGMTFSFLISSPLVDLGSLLLLTSIFGWKIAVSYVAVGLVFAVVGGTLIGKQGLEKQLEPELFGKAEKLSNTEYTNKKDRAKFALSEAWETLKYVFRFIVIGVAVGALIHNWLPAQWIETVLGENNPFSVIIASVAGIPMYADIFATITIAEALYLKGVGIGTVLSLMMGVTALSLPSMIMLRKVIKPKLLAIFISIVTAGIIIIGYLFNAYGLNVLKRKAAAGVEVKVLYDDIGCMATLPGDYHKTLKTYGIEATPFSRLKGNADSEFNNRSHRKITVIDGKIGYTGGVNITDEYINEIVKYGHWKDTSIRLEGEAVWELTKLFLVDFGINVKKMPTGRDDLYPALPIKEDGYIIPFGDGPHPIYERRVGKSVIQNMLSAATRYAWMTSPYLIIDNDLCTDLENAALRGVDVRIIVPHIPDKKLVFGMTQSFYHRLMAAGVKIYEYEPGFIHAKSYLVDDEYAMIGTINLDYRSLVHHFENGVWMYGCKSIKDLKADIEDTLSKSIEVTNDMLKTNLLQRFIRAVVRIFAPMM